MVATVDLVTSAGKRKTIFEYEPAYGVIGYRGVWVEPPLEPSATWLAPHSLKIAIGTVAAVGEQRSDVADLHISYEIGKNLEFGKDPASPN
jgi:hypothetical protein